ncbi:catalase A [Paecilomyces lecythidis]|uniref:Catalase A n=1 Tax=Paecilomyces lecythidis TaxID=3004212 RepID=A0ABR3WWF8_9EURO
MKLYTEEGNQDWVFNNTPVFFVRDPIKFPSLNRSHKRHPQTNLTDATMFWDPESIHEIMHVFSDRGTPATLRHMDAFSGHTYKFTKPDGSFKYVKIHIKSDLGRKTMTRQEAAKIAGEDPDYHTRDLFNAIETGNYPTWTVYVQVMSPEEAENYRWNIFDITKVWPHSDYPLRPIGKMTLNKNPTNYFEQIEQAAFSPSTMVPGFAASADPLLQARMFSYPDAARYRVGTNYQQLPTNAARCPVYSPFQRDGFMSFRGNYGADPNYVGSTTLPLSTRKVEENYHDHWVGEVTAFTSEVTDDDFIQPKMLWDVMGKQPGQQDNFISNVAAHLSGAIPEVQKETIKLFNRVDPEIGQRIEKALKA